jgi:hypothetical protein
MNAYRVSMEKSEEKGKLKDIGIKGKTQFKLILKQRIRFMQLRVETGGGLL